MIERRRRQGRPDWLVIARREFIERVRTPWFVIGTVLGPLIMIASIVVPAVLARTVDTASRSFLARLPRSVVEPTGTWTVRLAAGRQ